MRLQMVGNLADRNRVLFIRISEQELHHIQNLELLRGCLSHIANLRSKQMPLPMLVNIHHIIAEVYRQVILVPEQVRIPEAIYSKPVTP